MQSRLWPLAWRWSFAARPCLCASQRSCQGSAAALRNVSSAQRLQFGLSGPRRRSPFRHSRPSRAVTPGVLASSQDHTVTEKFLWDSDTIGNSTGIQFVMLGTSASSRSRHRGAPATILRRLGEAWLFDCGEDTQRQFLRQPLLRGSKLSRIFISSAEPDNILGLPGMLCTVSSSREIGLDSTDVPLHVYGPPGLAAYLRSMLQISDTFLAMPIIVHEFVQHAVPEEELSNPQNLDQRSCLYIQRIPPDQLNPEGYSDGSMTTFLQRRNRGKSRKGPDERLAVRPLNLPQPGDATRTDVSPGSMTWTVSCNTDFAFTAALLPNPTPSWCFIMEEAARVGALDPVRCQQLGVMPGTAFSQLKAGISVLNRAGEMVHAHQVLHADRPGRKIAVIGPSLDSLSVAHHAADADVVLHSATKRVLKPDGAYENQCTASMAGQFAQAAGARQLILTGFPDSIAPNQPLSIEERLIAFPGSASASNGAPMPAAASQHNGASMSDVHTNIAPHQQQAAPSGGGMHEEAQQHDRQMAGVASTSGRHASLSGGAWGRPALRGHAIAGRSLVRAGAAQRGMAHSAVIARDSPWHHWPRKNEQENARKDVQSQRKRGNASDQRLKQRSAGKGGHNPNKLRRRTREDHAQHAEMVEQRKARQQDRRPSSSAQQSQDAALGSEADNGKMIYTHVPHASQILVMGHKSEQMQALIDEASAAFPAGHVLAAQDFHLLEVRRRLPPNLGSSEGPSLSMDDIWHLK